MCRLLGHLFLLCAHKKGSKHGKCMKVDDGLRMNIFCWTAQSDGRDRTAWVIKRHMHMEESGPSNQVNERWRFDLRGYREKTGMEGRGLLDRGWKIQWLMGEEGARQLTGGELYWKGGKRFPRIAFREKAVLVHGGEIQQNYDT